MSDSWAEEAVDDIIEDLRDRRGLKQEWDHIDKEIQQEIRKSWVAIVKRTLGY